MGLPNCSENNNLCWIILTIKENLLKKGRIATASASIGWFHRHYRTSVHPQLHHYQQEKRTAFDQSIRNKKMIRKQSEVSRIRSLQYLDKSIKEMNLELTKTDLMLGWISTRLREVGFLRGEQRGEELKIL